MKDKKSKKKIYQEERELLSFKKILMMIEHLIMRPIMIGIANYLR